MRSDIGSDVVRRWAAQLPPGESVVDIGCGTGWPVARILACEPVQTSGFFGRSFDSAVGIGVLFLLSEADQRAAIARIAAALRPGGRLLFSAPRIACQWRDTLTGRLSLSLGEGAYRAILADHGIGSIDLTADTGGNDYFNATVDDPTRR